VSSQPYPIWCAVNVGTPLKSPPYPGLAAPVRGSGRSYRKSAGCWRRALESWPDAGSREAIRPNGHKAGRPGLLRSKYERASGELPPTRLAVLGNLVWRPRAESNRRGKDVPDSAQLIRKFSAKSRQIDLATSRTTAPWPRFLRILGICAICHARLRMNGMNGDANCRDCAIVLAACAARKVCTWRSPPLALRFSVHPDRS